MSSTAAPALENPSVGSSDSWCTLAEASRLLDRHVGTIKSIALAGGIRVRSLPGARTVYCRSDVERLTQEGNPDG